MPFDKTFTADEITAAIAEDSTIIDRIVPVLTAKDFVVRSKTADTTYANEQRTAAISEQTKTHAEMLEKDVLETTGIAKIEGEKYYDYNKRALKALKEREAELVELKKGSTLSDAEKQQLEQTKASIKDLNTKLADKDKTHAQELTQARAEGKIFMAVAGARSKYIKTLPEGVVKATEGVYVSQMMSEAKFTDDKKMYFAGADGKPLLNPTTQEFLTAEERYDQLAKDMLDPGQQAAGAGGNGGPKDGGDTSALPASITTQVAATDWLAAKGLVQGTKEYTKKYKELGIEKLPLR